MIYDIWIISVKINDTRWYPIRTFYSGERAREFLEEKILDGYTLYLDINMDIIQFDSRE